MRKIKSVQEKASVAVRRGCIAGRQKRNEICVYRCEVSVGIDKGNQSCENYGTLTLFACGEDRGPPGALARSSPGIGCSRE